MKEKVYIETSVISYLSGRLSRDIIIVGRQEITREIWPHLAEQFDCYISSLVREEIERGDPEAANNRLAVLTDIATLTISDEARDFTKAIVENGLMPRQFTEDALHIAIATMHGVDYLLTWNFKHLNNVQTKVKIADFIEDCGYEPPQVCSPDELFGDIP
jgi:hypothetical protein